MIRLIFSLVLLLAFQISSAAELPEVDKREVMTRFNAFTDAFHSKNYEMVESITFPKIVEMGGGHDSYIAALKKIDTSIGDGGMTFISVDAKKPTELIDAGDYDVCIIPTVIVMLVQNERLRETSFTFAVRKKQTSSWTLIGSAGLRKHPEMLFTLLPSFPKSVPLPVNVIEKIDMAGNLISINRPSAEEIAKISMQGRSFPIRVDEFTNLNSIVGSNNQLIYDYSAVEEIESPETIKMISEQIIAGANKQACSSKNFTALLKGGYSLVFNYSIGRSKQLVHVEIQPGTCDN